MVGDGNGSAIIKAVLKRNLPFSFPAFGESIMEDIAQIVASVFGQSSRLSFMNPAWTLISVMLTKKMSGTSQTNPSMPGNRTR